MYTIRILKAYRENCNIKWTDTTDNSEPINPLLRLMNEHCDQRAKILDDALVLLNTGIKRDKIHTGIELLKSLFDKADILDTSGELSTELEQIITEFESVL